MHGDAPPEAVSPMKGSDRPVGAQIVVFILFQGLRHLRRLHPWLLSYRPVGAGLVEIPIFSVFCANVCSTTNKTYRTYKTYFHLSRETPAFFMPLFTIHYSLFSARLCPEGNRVSLVIFLRFYLKTRIVAVIFVENPNHQYRKQGFFL